VIHTARVPAPPTTPELNRLRRLVPLGRIGEPGDVARVIAVLLSDVWCGYVNGANVRVDGGMGVHSWSFDSP
jgi:NAD(P)-dependent dehydrogenase (short-subunit alcohol dehydrogenase family)